MNSPENLLQIYLKLTQKSTGNLPKIAHEQLSVGVAPPPPTHTHTHTHTPWCVLSERSLIYRPCISPTKVLCIIL
jgi:hypothetical protein